jgi:hypothetical protein
MKTIVEAYYMMSYSIMQKKIILAAEWMDKPIQLTVGCGPICKPMYGSPKDDIARHRL